MTEPEKVYSREDLVGMLADFIDALSDEEKAAVAPETMGIIENVTDGINQVFDRLDRSRDAAEKARDVNEGLVAKINAYAADQVDRMRDSTKTDDDENPAQQLIEATLEDGE